MSDRLDPATLEAYADGQLSPEAMIDTAERLLRDPEALARVRALQGDAARLRAAYRDSSETPVPPELLAAIDRGFAARQPRTRRPGPRAALAAAVALVLLGGLAGYFTGEYRLRDEMETAAAREMQDQQILAAAVSQALERSASGESLAWRNPDSGTHGQVIPVRTYRSKSNHWCREYRASKVSAGAEEKIRAIACRAADGGWIKVEQHFYDS